MTIDHGREKSPEEEAEAIMNESDEGLGDFDDMEIDDGDDDFDNDMEDADLDEDTDDSGID